ncbi:MAG: hypothetical protein K0R13_2033 [Propionibacteriaceae bacterium]|nr:hypothetical protein [Propionibacteriaceae bacterium]
MFTPAQPAAAFDPRQPFSRAEARAAGLTAEMLLGRQFHKICWDTYVAREVPITPLLRAKAVIRLVPSGSYVSHHTAAELWGAAPLTLPSACGRLVRQGVRSHYRRHPAQITRRKGVPGIRGAPAHHRIRRQAACRGHTAVADRHLPARGARSDPLAFW